MSFAIVKDSTAYMPRDLLRHFQITIVPLTVTYDGVTYRDGLDIAPEKFYQRLSHVSQLPVTSPPSLESLIATYEALAETHDGILSVHLSADYSRTVDIARQAAAAVDIPVEVIDSRSISQRTTLHLAVTKGCSSGPCVVRILLGRAMSLTPGDKLRAYGKVSRAFPQSPGKTIPEIHAAFVIRTTP